MKTACFIFFLAASLPMRAAIITAVQNGNWTNASTWDLNRTPADGDKVVIAAGIVVMFVNTPYPQNNPVARPTFNVSIYGTLDFSSPGNDKMYLDAGSSIQIYAGGKIQTTTSSTEIIAIYNGSADNTVWTGSPGNVNGPAYANATTAGFASGILPVLIESFTIQRAGHAGAKLSWTTSMEQNSSHFEIEYFQTGKWNVIGAVTASGYSNSPINYSFITVLHQGENHFRLREVDIDNAFTYSNVVSINNDGAEQPEIIYSSSDHSLVVNNTNDAVINLIDLSGRRLLSMRYSGHAVQLLPLQRGIYVAQVSTPYGIYAEKIVVR
jgi:hypothetical protein